MAAVGLVVLLALLFAFGVIGGSDEGPGTSTEAGPSATSSTATQPAAPRYQRADMTTIVLNASGSGGLAKDVSDSIEERFRFPMGEAANFTIGGANQSSATTTVQYRTVGDESVSQNRAAAQDIARFLKLRVTNTVVRRMTTDVRASAPSQKVVVIVGADYARANPPAGAPGTNGTTSTPDGGTATPATPGTTGGTSTTTPQSTSTSQLQTPDTTDLGTGGAVDGTDGTGGTTVP
ncbi:unannotated protein [freshwater metagenome]|uniref:Unannotated protein n=1 Tax=freshwater metagenome TaxID=449393 RepID=A0A6J7GH37_9ZZZZ